ncbi:unnamed protein product [Mytilus coruscus]|uniref:Uncharacterized protein n=1 Tax=Mytilus coruscus TaxID=42192 RepID=A0A6J8EAA2_MYTCO|nr:unnamed protein product [Mytilus coruscus]
MAGKGHHLIKTVVKKCPSTVFYRKYTRKIPYKKVDFHEKCLREIRDIPWHIQEPEMFVTELLANHLFSKLTMSSFVTAKDYHTKLSKCPCGRCNDTIQFDNFGIGSEWLWYGKPDIVVYKSDNEINSIALPQSNDNEREDKELIKELDFEEQQIIDVQKQSEILRYPSNVSQFVAHAITFSYYQKTFQHRHRKIENLQNNVSLVPLIAISGNFFDIYLYDCENDILLRNANQISLWNEPEFKCTTDFEFPEPTLNVSSVIMIWMMMNHLIIKPSLSDETVLRLKKSCGLDLSVELLKAIEKTVKLKKNFYPLKSCGNEIIEPYFSQRLNVESQQ